MTVRVATLGLLACASAACGDNDHRGGGELLVTPVAGLHTNEAGGTAQFSVVLTLEPDADITVTLDSSNVGEGTVAPSHLMFTQHDWNRPQHVVVTGVDDDRADGPLAYTIFVGPATSGDPMFDGIDPDDVQVTNVDDDLEDIVVTPVAGLVTTERGGTATFSVVLATQPTADVTIAVTSTAPSEALANVGSLVFTTTNWSTPQVVTVVGQNDYIDDDDQPFTIVLWPAVSTDPRYSGIDPFDVDGTNLDDDTRGLNVSPLS